jgi:hypothetical protein
MKGHCRLYFDDEPPLDNDSAGELLLEKLTGAIVSLPLFLHAAVSYRLPRTASPQRRIRAQSNA